jgi:hypothetical protein
MFNLRPLGERRLPCHMDLRASNPKITNSCENVELAMQINDYPARRERAGKLKSSRVVSIQPSSNSRCC